MPPVPRFVTCWLFVGALALCAPALGEDGSDKALPSAMLYLADGDYFAGTLEDSQTADVIDWQSVGATQPFRFPTSSIRAAYFPPQPHAAPPQTEYRFELADGDALFGSLARLTPEELEIESPRFGRLRVEHSQVRRITRSDGPAAWEYSGPNSLTEWQQPDENSWREEAGHLLTSVSGAALRKEVQIPPQARIELVLSWNGQPDFVFAICAGASEAQERAGFRFEVWGKSLVAVRELEKDADVASLGELDAAKNRLHVEAYLDQEQGSLSIHSVDGTRLADIRVEEAESPLLNRILLLNQRGNVRLEQLVVGHWDGQLPPQVEADRPRIHQTDGAVIYGETVGYDSAKKQFIVREQSQEKQIAASHVASVVLHTAAGEPAGSLRVGFHDGSRISGELMKVESRQLYLARRGIEPTLVFLVADVRSFVGLRRRDMPISTANRQGRLEFDGVRSYGFLVDGMTDGQTSCLVWQPRQSATSSPLGNDISARIVYVEPQPPRQPPTEDAAATGQRARWFRGALERVFGPRPVQPVQSLPGSVGTLFLLAGDRIPCDVTEIDDQGVHFTSSVIEATFIPHEQIKALEFVPQPAIDALSEEKRQRILTLPRVQRENPPTHLVLSTSGDLLRARLLSLDAESLLVESRLDTKRIPRNRIACLIWLHDGSREQGADSKEQQVDSRPAPLRVQAVRADGVRLTFVPHACAENTLVGRSDLLGACQVDLSAVDQVLLGDKIDTTADEQTYHGWKLQDAVEPRFVRAAAADGSDGVPGGIESSLVGKPAADFRLELLEGGHLHLSEQKGHVVVLDFWASWCGPCMQAMPQVHQVVEEFEEHGVELVAVNMQEDRTTIAGALERLGLQVAVALDIDGATAEKYEVTAIPQTVVIDPAGNVARLFIGAGPDFVDQLRETLEQLVAKSDPSTGADH